MRRLIALVTGCALVAACAGVDKQKFEPVSKAGKDLQAEVPSSNTLPPPQFRDRLKQFDNEIAALQGKTIGQREVDALKAFSEAADAFRYFLRFRVLDLDAADPGQILVKGPNLEVANRYRLPVDARNGSKWVNRGQAITILLQAGEQHLNDGNRIVDGQ